MPEQLILDFSLDRLNREERAVYDRIPSGRPGAVTVAALSADTGICEREVRAIVSDLINVHGLLVASATSHPAGYYRPVTDEEILGATKALRHRGIKILARAARLSKSGVEEVFRLARLEMREGEDVPSVR